MIDRVGQQIGNYRLIRLLGEGGFAEVYLGEHLHLGTYAAIKILQTQLTRDDVEQFRSEARIIASLEHPNIVRVLDFGVEGKIPFLVMSYAPNGTLRQLHGKGESVPLPTIVSYVKQVADALQYAHEQKLIHRDVKPENMLLGRRHEVLLSDFGIALVAQSSHYQGTRDVVGTVAYMAPEQIQGKPRPASDQYALGIIVYEWLSGVRPFQGSFSEIAVQHTIVPPPPLRDRIPAISPDIEQVVLMALAKDPQQRFANIQAFANALEQACEPTQRYGFAPPGQRPQPINTALQTDPGADFTAAATPASQPGEGAAHSTVVATPWNQAQNTPAVGIMPGGLQSPKRGISRRTALVGLGIVGAAVAGGGLTWFVLSQKQRINPAPKPTATSVQFSSGTATPALPTPTSTTTSSTPTNTPTHTVTSTPIGTTLFTYHGHSGYIYGVTWSSVDGQRVASASLDTTVQAWNPTTGTQYFTYNHSKAVNDVKSSSDKTRIASAGEDSIVQVRNAANGNQLFTYTQHSAAVNTVEWSPNGPSSSPGGGSRIVSASTDKTVQIWDASNGSTIAICRGHSNTVWAAGWSPDGQRVVSASADGTARVWDATTGNVVFIYTGHSATVRSVSWSPDGQRIATASEDLTVQVWDASTGSRLFVYQGHSDLLRTVAWSHDGTRIVSGGRDATAQIWNASTGNTVYTYRGHSATVFDAQWSPDGTHIASGSTDTTVQVWQAL